MVYGIVLLVSGAAGWILTLASVRLAVRCGILDRPADHKIHGRATPRLGGIGIVLGAASGMAAAALMGIHFDVRMLVLLAGGLAMAGLGVVDDVLCLKAGSKLAAQVAIAVIVGLWTASIGSSGRMWLVDAAVTAMLIVLLSNAVNLIDGMDGLAAGIVLIASWTYASILLGAGNISAAVLSLTIVGACVGFLPHNWHPARTFMGDSGSLFLGYCLAAQMLLSSKESASAWGFAASLAIAGLPLLDTLLSIVRRILARKPLFAPDAAHSYNLLAKRFNLADSSTVLVFCFTGACFAAAGFLAFVSTGLLARLLLLGFLCALLGFAVGMLRLLSQESQREFLPGQDG